METIAFGRAGEHLVCADLLLQGFRCYMTDHGCPYDVAVDIGERVLRVQVKTTGRPKNINTKGTTPTLGYGWNIRRRGGNGRGRLDTSHCDIVALVAMDIRAIAYMSLARAGQTIQLRPPGIAARIGCKSWYGCIDKYPFSAALGGL